ncbi:hypothetical protein DUI87_30973 [Hirundo rustica rustica]|uniref:Core shell protein Gag P30 domain-containing protein n=1 Tax=Hirundo rustica rustica TaxID=333673 RepID=A0A3M0IUY4_HIRRU|nr:hypothetical protein DUI87_30973 [Hirundo rustica rustica]
MILQKAWQLWEDEHPQAAGGAVPNVPTVDDAIPQVDPQWNPNEETSLALLHDYCVYLIRAIKSAVPRTNNIAEAMSLEQEKHESPSHWLERIREALRKHGGMDPEGPAFDTLLKVQFITKAWPDIQKGVQKDEEWQNKPLEELVRKTQQIYVRRDEEKGYKNSPTIFGEQLAKDLESWEPPPGEGQLLQYVDDFLIATQTQETCVDCTVSLLNFLGLQGYRVSQKKAQMVRQTVIYLGYEQGIALGIVAQNLGPYRRAVAYLSKQLDTAAKGWPGCLRTVAAVAINIQEACKFTLGQKMTVLVSHTMSAVLEAKGGHWLSPQRFLKYQAILVEQDDVEIMVTNIVNPASFLSGSTGEPVIHDCLETIEATYSSHPDLEDTLLEDAETWFTDRSRTSLKGTGLNIQHKQNRRLGIQAS